VVLRKWLATVGVITLSIEPGSPERTSTNKSLNGRLDLIETVFPFLKRNAFGAFLPVSRKHHHRDLDKFDWSENFRM